MAQTAHKTDEEKKEFFDSPEELDRKVTRLAEMVMKSKHFISFTGAGISTSAGIPDYRSGVNTVLPTGPGCWEKQAQKVKDNGKKPLRTSMLQAIPTKTHMALVALEQRGLLKHIISQNIDGLHRRSAFPPEKLSEVHGNTNLEVCLKKGCRRQYLRDYKCRTAQKTHDHKTTRRCVCGEPLYDSIVNFGEDLPAKVLDDGFAHAAKADLCLALGSSLRVTPAADMPQQVGETKGSDLVIVNLQKTPLDRYASLCIYAFCDQVMELLCAKLQLQIPDFVLERRFQVVRNKNDFRVQGLDRDGLPFSLFKSVKFQPNKDATRTFTKEPFVYQAKPDLKGVLGVELEFQGHYAEPMLRVDLQLDTFTSHATFLIAFDPKLKERLWTIKRID